MIIDIETLGLDQGGDILIKQALTGLNTGETLCVRGTAGGIGGQLRAFARQHGHAFHEMAGSEAAPEFLLTNGGWENSRWVGAAQTGALELRIAEAVKAQAQAEWGLAARGARVEQGAPGFSFRYLAKNEIWSSAPDQFYRQAVAAQWKADEAIDWSAEISAVRPEVEQALVQILTYMIENENAALIIPAKFLSQIHPHFREIQAILAMQIADEARHIDVFSRRIALGGHQPAHSGAGGQASLKTLVEEGDFSVSGFLLSVLGEGTFVTLLNFLSSFAPDPVTLQIMRLAARDEARHVAFGMAHLEYRLTEEPELRERLARAVIARHEALANTEGLNQDVYDSLVIYAAGSLTPSAIAQGFEDVQHLYTEMALGRRARMIRLGFEPELAMHLATMHTRNFM